MSRFSREELRDLIMSGVARDEADAEKILEEAAQQERNADLFVFFSDPHLVREAFGDCLVDERPYANSRIRMANVACGVLGRVKKAQSNKPTMILAAIKEFCHERTGDGEPIADGEGRLVAFARKLTTPIRDKRGVFFSPYSAEAVHAVGKRTVDEKEGLLRVEFMPVDDDYVQGMFKAWNDLPESLEYALVLWIPRSKVITIHQ